MIEVIDNSVSKPSAKMKILIVASFIAALAICASTGRVLDLVIFAVFVILNCLLLIPRCLWGFEIKMNQVIVEFPLWPRMNQTFLRDEVDRVEIVRNPIRLFSYSDFVRLRFAERKKLTLVLMGTSNPKPLLEFLKTQIGSEKDGESG